MNNGYNPTARSTDPQTSRDAAQAQQGAKVYDQVLATIQQAGAKGCTLDDLAAALPNHEKISISPAPARLKEQGIIYETGTTRTGKSGRQQIVHTAYMPGEQVSIPAVTQRARRSANTATAAPQVEMVSELQRLSELATAGPWLSDQYDETEEGCPLIAVIEENGLRSPTRGMVAWFTAIAGASFESPERCEANAKFIAALVNWFRENQAALTEEA